MAVTTTLEMLWLPLCAEPALGLLLGEAVEEVAEEAVEGEEAEGNQPLFLHNSSSPFQPPQTYESWGHCPDSLTEKETKPMPS